MRKDISHDKYGISGLCQLRASLVCSHVEKVCAHVRGEHLVLKLSDKISGKKSGNKNLFLLLRCKMLLLLLLYFGDKARIQFGKFWR